VSSRPLEPFDLETTLRKLADRTFTATLHRLRGVRGLLHGWSQVGVPVQDASQLETRFEEDLNLLSRLDWLRSLLLHQPPLERLEGGEAPMVLLACALGHGTPSENRQGIDGRLPQAKQPAGALSLALWLEAVNPVDRTADHHWGFEGEQMYLLHQNPQPVDCQAWLQRYGNLLADGSRPTEGKLVYRGGVFLAQKPAHAVGF